MDRLELKVIIDIDGPNDKKDAVVKHMSENIQRLIWDEAKEFEEYGFDDLVLKRAEVAYDAE